MVVLCLHGDEGESCFSTREECLIIELVGNIKSSNPFRCVGPPILLWFAKQGELEVAQVRCYANVGKPTMFGIWNYC